MSNFSSNSSILADLLVKERGYNNNIGLRQHSVTSTTKQWIAVLRSMTRATLTPGTGTGGDAAQRILQLS